MKFILTLIVTLFSVSFLSATEVKIDAKKYGIFPNTSENMSAKIGELIKIVLQKSQAGESVEILFEKGVYNIHEEGAVTKEMYLSNHDQVNPKKIAFAFEKGKNITVNGQGALFMFHGRMIPFIMEDCENMQLKNFFIDFKQTHIGQLEILKINEKERYVVAKTIEGVEYEVENGKLFFKGEGWRHTPQGGIAFDFNRHIVQSTSDLPFNPSRVEKCNDGTLKIYDWIVGRLPVGTRFAGRIWFRPCPGIVASFCKNTTLKNVTVHYSEGMSFLAQMSENITLDGFNVKLRDSQNDKRYFTAQADATHFSACKGKITSINGLYEGQMDDAINVHGTYLNVLERLDDHRVKARYMHGQAFGFLWGYAGDEIQFINSKTMEICGKNKVKSIKPLDKSTPFGAREYEICFEDKLVDEVGKATVGIENLTWTPEVVFSNNTIRNNRARGALFSTPQKVVIENNIFDHVTGCAILLCGDCNGWFETGACTDILIRGNTFINSLTSNFQFTNAVISIYPEIPDLKEQKKYFHSNIVIEKNIFKGFEPCLVYAKSVDGLVIKDNIIECTTDYKPAHWNKHPFFFERVRNITLESNHYFEGFPTEFDKVYRLNLTDKSEIKQK